MKMLLKALAASFLALNLALPAMAQKTPAKPPGVPKAIPAQSASLLRSGPMVAYSEIREAAIWVQATRPAQVKIQYRPIGSTEKFMETMPVMTDREMGNTATVVLGELTKGTKYEYQVMINGRKEEFPFPTQFQTLPYWQYRTDPPNFTFAVGSCNYVTDTTYDRPGKPYGSEHEIFTAITKDKPDAFLWLGDNAYYREADWNTKSGMIYRQSHTRALAETRALFASTHNYATWDDHDFGPNDANRSFGQRGVNADIFRAFWPMLNTNLTGQGGVTSTFEWGDAQFFLLDDRYFRAPNEDTSKGKQFFGDAQLEWLREALISSKATFKIVACGGQMLNTAAIYENLSTYPKEYEKFLNLLLNSPASGIFLMSGDRHHSELQKMDRTGTYPIYELTCSPLTAGAANPKETNNYRVEGTLIPSKHNYALVNFSGPRRDRKMTITMKGVNGEEIWKREIMANELRAPRKEEKKD